MGMPTPPRICQRPGCNKTIPEFKRRSTHYCCKTCSRKKAQPIPPFYAPDRASGIRKIWGMSFDHFYPEDGCSPVQMVGAYDVVDHRRPDRWLGF